MEVLSTTDTVTNSLIIDTNKTLTISGDVIVGPDIDASNNSSTKLVATGGGSLVVNGANFQVGGSTVSTNRNAANVDLSGLANFTAELGLGTLRVGDVSQQSSTNSATSDLRLATNNTITAGNLFVGMGVASENTADPHSLILGSGVNVFNVNVIAVGSGTGSSQSRSSGEIIFDAGDATGTLKIRGADTTSAALTMNVGNSTSTVNQSWVSIVDLTGHSVDVLVNDLIMGQRISASGGNGNVTSTLSFDTGTFTLVDDLFMARRTTTGNGDATATLNIGGGVFTVGDDTTMSVAAGGNADSTTTATINVTGGQVFFNGIFSMANAAAGQTATSTLNITGGMVTMTPSITVTGDGTVNATVILDGGTLDMTDSNIGTAANMITFDVRSGTLQNLNNLNGGGDLTKTTAGTLILEGVNDFSGSIIVSAGKLQLGDGSGDGSGSVAAGGSISVASGAVFSVNQNDTVIQGTDFSGSAISGDGGFEQTGTGTTVFNVDNTYAGVTTVSAGTLQIGEGGGTGSIDSSSGVTVASGAVLKTNRDATLTLSQVISGTGAVEVANAATGVTVLTAANDYTGTTSVTSGTLQVGDGSSGSLTGSGTVTVSNAGSQLSGSGSIAGSTIIGSGSVLAPGVGDTVVSNKALIFTAASTALEVQNGGQIQLGITNETFNSSAYVESIGSGAATDALSFLGGVGAGELASWNAAPMASSDMDFINLTNGTISLGTRSGGTGTGTISIADLGYVASAAQGDVFNLIDWQGVMGGTFSAGSGFVNGGVLGDFDLPTLGLGLQWDTSAFTTYGIVVVVPEPSRALLLMLGLFGLMLRRRRK
ncbi:MAG: autotransporter-associated beta strand repeat-containing protein [Prosthecobacter sp.]